MNSLHRKMVEEICQHFSCNFNEVFSRRRQKNLVYAKKVIYWILRKERLTFNQIARMLEKDHETIIKGIRTLPDQYRSYAQAILNKYKKWGIREQKIQDDEVFTSRMNKIADFLNKGLSEQQIADRLGDSCNKVASDISLYINKKKVPDYNPKSVGYKIIHIFAQKNKKNY